MIHIQPHLVCICVAREAYTKFKSDSHSQEWNKKSFKRLKVSINRKRRRQRRRRRKRRNWWKRKRAYKKNVLCSFVKHVNILHTIHTAWSKRGKEREKKERNDSERLKANEHWRCHRVWWKRPRYSAWIDHPSYCKEKIRLQPKKNLHKCIIQCQAFELVVFYSGSKPFFSLPSFEYGREKV